MHILSQSKLPSSLGLIVRSGHDEPLIPLSVSKTLSLALSGTRVTLRCPCLSRTSAVGRGHGTQTLQVGERRSA